MLDVRHIVNKVEENETYSDNVMKRRRKNVKS